jgi:cell division FtsZ-interacting protein ZapD
MTVSTPSASELSERLRKQAGVLDRIQHFESPYEAEEAANDASKYREIADVLDRIEELEGRSGVLSDWTNRLQAICEQHGAHGGDNRIDFIEAKLDAQAALLSEAEKFLTDLRSCVNGEGPYSRGSDSDTLDALYGDAGALSDKIREATQ